MGEDTEDQGQNGRTDGDEADVSFMDLFRPSVGRVTRTQRKERMDLCRSCDHYSSTTTQCGVCGCLMPLKTTLAPASCPIGKWGPVDA